MVLSITGNNLWLKTNYGGVKHQIDSQGGSKRNRGIGYLSSDWTVIPAPRSYAMSVNINFYIMIFMAIKLNNINKVGLFVMTALTLSSCDK